jgi:hypothetical protein
MLDSPLSIQSDSTERIKAIPRDLTYARGELVNFGQFWGNLSSILVDIGKLELRFAPNLISSVGARPPATKFH